MPSHWRPWQLWASWNVCWHSRRTWRWDRPMTWRRGFSATEKTSRICFDNGKFQDYHELKRHITTTKSDLPRRETRYGTDSDHVASPAPADHTKGFGKRRILVHHVVGHHEAEHSRDATVRDRADEQRDNNAYGNRSLRSLDFLARSCDTIEADKRVKAFGSTGEHTGHAERKETATTARRWFAFARTNVAYVLSRGV